MSAPGSAGDPTAVIGAGLAGLTCARELQRQGVQVRVFDKARGPGGRMATRRSEVGRFDHGAQYFTARDPGFAAFVDEQIGAGRVEPWKGRLVALDAGTATPAGGATTRYVATPRMSALPRALGEGLDLECARRIAEVRRAGHAWLLHDKQGGAIGPFARVVVATPAEQAVPLLAGSPPLAERAARAVSAPCLAVMLGLAAPLDVGFDAAFVENSAIGWVAREGGKPGRDVGERWVVHASADWSQAHLEEAPDDFVPSLLEAFAHALGRDLPPVTHAVGHRWRFARVTTPLDEDCLLDEAIGLGACGDWCGGDRVEAAWRSGRALADRLLAADAAETPGSRS